MFKVIQLGVTVFFLGILCRCQSIETTASSSSEVVKECTDVEYTSKTPCITLLGILETTDTLVFYREVRGVTDSISRLVIGGVSFTEQIGGDLIDSSFTSLSIPWYRQPVCFSGIAGKTKVWVTRGGVTVAESGDFAVDNVEIDDCHSVPKVIGVTLEYAP